LVFCWSLIQCLDTLDSNNEEMNMTAHSLAHQGVLERLAKSFPSLFHHHAHEPFGEQRMIAVPERKHPFSAEQLFRKLMDDHQLTAYGFEETLPFLRSVPELSSRQYGVLPLETDMATSMTLWRQPDLLDRPSRFEDVAWLVDRLIRTKDPVLLPSPDSSLVFLLAGNDGHHYTMSCTWGPEPLSPSWMLFVGPFSRSNQWSAGCRLAYPLK
jgi:hypothetical protein